MKVALYSELEADSALFEQVVHDRGRVKHTCWVKVHLDKFAEARRVVIFERLCVAKRFQERVRVKDLLLNGRVLSVGSLFGLLKLGFFVEEVLLGAAETFARPRQIRKNDLRCLCLARTGLASDDDGLVLVVNHEVLV